MYGKIDVAEMHVPIAEHGVRDCLVPQNTWSVRSVYSILDWFDALVCSIVILHDRFRSIWISDFAE